MIDSPTNPSPDGPPGRREEYSPFMLPTVNFVLRSLFWVNVHFLIQRLWAKDDEHRGQWLLEVYGSTWFILTAGTLAAIHFADWTAETTAVRWIAWLCTYRVATLGHSVLCYVLLDQLRAVRLRNTETWFLMSILTVGEIVQCFAVIIFATGAQWDPNVQDVGMAFYQSVVTITTLGFGDISPTTGLTRFIIVAELFYFVLIVVLLLPMLLTSLESSARE